MILSVFLTLSSYSLAICDGKLSYSRNDNRHRATLSHKFRFNSEKYRTRVSYPCLCNMKVYQNKLSLGIFERSSWKKNVLESEMSKDNHALVIALLYDIKSNETFFTAISSNWSSLYCGKYGKSAHSPKERASKSTTSNVICLVMTSYGDKIKINLIPDNWPDIWFWLHREYILLCLV